MVALLNDPYLQRRLMRCRRAWGADRYDEVWDGVNIISETPNNQHQDLVARLAYVCHSLIVDPGLGRVHPGCNVTDRPTKWKQNYRIPDVAVFLNGTTAVDKESHWFGGPDLAIEIVSPRDKSREKLEFYAKVGTRELLIVDRDPWSLELYRLTDGTLSLTGRSTLDQPDLLETEVVLLTWQLIPGGERPMVEVIHKG
ncbi:MAG: Uma2 family endonuclease, partial [Planctomycetaceae bacterium]|nr:Uma2 family endonuclease [Planctomycetaceae bacterium]